MRLTFLILIMPLLSAAQEIKSSYFTKSFQTMTFEKTKYVRYYDYKDGEVIIKDYYEQDLIQQVSIRGLSKTEEINAFAFYCLMEGREIYYRDYFKNAKAKFDFYNGGKMNRQLIVHDKTFKNAQVWNKEGQKLLINGSGENTYMADSGEEEITMVYKDSTLMNSYSVRTKEKDTIYHSFDKMAAPKDGYPHFLSELAATVNYPVIARLAGAEGRVYIQFIVDEKGKLTEFKPLTKIGYKFEAKVLDRLEQLPDWDPAIYHNRPVKSRYSLPVKFQLED